LNSKQLINGLILFCIGAWVLLACDQTPPSLPGNSNSISLSFYPDNEIVLHDTFSLFTTDILVTVPEQSIGVLKLTIVYAQQYMQFASALSETMQIDTIDKPGQLTITVSGGSMGPGESLKVGTLTWKALATAITDMEITVESMTTPDNTPVYIRKHTSTVKILKETGEVLLTGLAYIKKGQEFSRSVTLNLGDENIKEYDFNINFDADNLSFNTAVGISGIETGANGFISTVNVNNGTIHITGTNAAGMGPGEALELVKMQWTALYSGRYMLTLDINKLVTVDDVYLKPGIRNSSISVYSDSNKPVVNVWLEPDVVDVTLNTPFTTIVMLNIQGYVLAAYGIDIYYNPALIALDKSAPHSNGLEAGSEGFLTVFNALVPGELRTAGFDLKGKAPDSALELIALYWNGIGVGMDSPITLDIKSLSDIRTRSIDGFESKGSVITINP